MMPVLSSSQYLNVLHRNATLLTIYKRLKHTTFTLTPLTPSPSPLHLDQ